jgi:hypothetical protein
MDTAYIPARESVALAGPGDSRVLLTAEALEAAGYDPAIYHAVVPSEGMRGGRLNKNGRIYGSVDEVGRHHMDLVRRAREGYVGGWQGHSLRAEESDCPVDAIRMLDGDVVAEEDGSVLARCLVGILKTTRGNDVNTMWRAGKPTGLSLFGICTATEHTIAKDSPYAVMNPTAVGQKIELRRLKALEKYDVVFDPSFATFFAAPEGVAATESVVVDGDSPEVIAAAGRLRAAGALIEPGREAKETNMDIKDLKALETAFPELVKQACENAVKAATEATVAQGSADRERVVALEAANKAADDRIKATESALATMRADAERAVTVNAIRKAIEAWQVGKPGGREIAADVLAQADAGAYQSAEEATKGAETLKAAFDRYSAAAKATPIASLADRANLTGERDATEGTQNARPKSALERLAGLT